jgi:two-component system sensor histidine kinase EvgS
VLVIEDHPTNQAMMAWRLQQLGVPHVLVGDGQQALDRLASESFDLVITDCRMPVLDGLASPACCANARAAPASRG